MSSSDRDEAPLPVTGTLPIFAAQPNPLRNVAANWGAFVFSAVVNFSLSPFIVHSLGDTVYGAWVLVGAMIGYLALLDLGVRGAVTRYVARMHAEKAHDDASRITSAALTLFCVAGAVALLISVVLALLLHHLFNIPPELMNTARIVLVIGGVNVALSLVFGVFGGVVAAMQRFDLSSGLDVLVEALRVAAIVIALKSGAGLITLSVIQLGGAVLRGGGQLWLARGLYPLLSFRLGVWSRPEFRRIFSFSVYSTFLHVAGMITMQTDSIVIGAALPVGMITAYAIAANLVGYARVISSGASQTLTPQASALEGRGDTQGLKTLTLTAARVTTLVMLPIVITFLLRGGTFIGLWMGPDYAAPAGEVLFILALALYVSNPRAVAVSVLLGLGLHRGLVLPHVAEALVNLGLSILLVGTLGIAGVAWGTAIPGVVLSTLFIPWYLKRTIGLSPRALAFHGWITPTLAMLPFAAATFVVEKLWPVTSVFAFFGQVALVLPAAAVGGVLIGLTPGERTRLAAGVRRRWPFRS